MAPTVSCHRCGREADTTSAEFRAWLVVNAWEDEDLYACPACQSGSERRTVAEIRSELDAMEN
jgi:hypothetical protein